MYVVYIDSVSLMKGKLNTGTGLTVCMHACVCVCEEQLLNY